MAKHVYDTLIVGSRLHRHRRGDQAQPGRRRRLRDRRARRPRRRHLARQHVSRCGMRHPVAAVLVLVRKNPDLVARLLRRQARSASTSRTWSTSSTCAAASSSASRSTGCRSTKPRASGRRRRRPQDCPSPAPWCWRRGRCPTTSCPTSGASTPTRARHPQRTLGPRLRLHRQAGRGHRNRSQRRADRPRTWSSRPSSSRSSNARPAGCCRGWTSRCPTAAQELFAKVPATQQLARQALFWGHEVSATALVWNITADRAGGPVGQGPSAPSGQGPVAAAPAHPGLHARLQAHADLQRLLPCAAARQLQADRLADRDHQPRRHPHQRRHRTPPRLHRVRHRIRRAPDRAAVSRSPGSADGRWPTSGPAARRPTRASTHTAIRTCSS